MITPHKPGKVKVLVLLLTWTSLCLFGMSGLHAQQDQRAVRAAYLFNLSKYVSWPHDMRELKICSLADQRTSMLLKHLLEGKSSDGRSVRVILNPSELEERQCAILYVDSAPQKRTITALQEIGNAPVLTVGDDAGFTHRGGMVGLVRSEDQIQLFVNTSALRSAGIQMSSRLLDIAVIVQPGRRN